MSVSRVGDEQTSSHIRTRFPVLSDKTMIFTESSLSKHLKAYNEDVVQGSPSVISKQRIRIEKIIRYVFPRMKSLAADLGLHLLYPEFYGDAVENLAVTPADEFDVVFIFGVKKVKMTSVDPGYVVIPVERAFPGELDEWRFGRSKNGLHLSPLKVSKTMHRLLKRVIVLPVTLPNVRLEPLLGDNGETRIQLIIGKSLKLNITPGIVPRHKKCPLLIARPYEYDRNPSSDISWRFLYASKEREILSSMDGADRGCRRKACRILIALFQNEATLFGLSPYHLKTVLLHNFDSAVDGSGTWQRNHLEVCVINLLTDMLQCIKAKRLNHFFVRDYNIFENVPDKVRRNLSGRLAYILDNENEFIRILKKRRSLMLS